MAQHHRLLCEAENWVRTPLLMATCISGNKFQFLSTPNSI